MLIHEGHPLRYDTAQTIESVSDTTVVDSNDGSVKDVPSDARKALDTMLLKSYRSLTSSSQT